MGRIKSRTLNTPSEMTNRYEYKASESYSGYTTPLVSKETFKVGDTDEEEYRYTYDANNNITSIKDKNDKLVVSYQYDGLNRLIRENIAGGDTTIYKYDKDGNIQLCKRVSFESGYGHTIEDILENITGGEQEYKYTFVNKDLLSSYNGSELLVYDNCGQPVMWFKHGAEKSSLKYILQWSELCLMAVTDADTQKMYYYKYNDQGIRTEKVIDGIRHKYYLQGEQIIAEKIGDKYIKYYYDGTGICGFNYDGTDYYYQKNIFGDILKIYDGNGKVYGEYGYTAWGKCRIKTNINGIGEINPFRYRGYYYDEEISLYYLNARYYDPEIGRFISADSIAYLEPASINGLNLYIYCLNNPISYVDYGGYFPQRYGDWLVVNKNLKFRLNDKEHIHVISNNIEYAWYRISKKTKDPLTNRGLNDLPKAARKALQKAGVPKDYFSKTLYGGLPRWQEGFSSPYMLPYQESFSIDPLPRWQEGFSLPQTNNNTIVTIVTVSAGVFVIVCVVGAFFTGGQSLWGLLGLV